MHDHATDRSIYLEDANGTLYLAEPVDPRHVPTVGPLYRLTCDAEQVDVLAASKASLAATAAWLDAHTAPGEESGSAGRRPSPGASSGSTCSGGAS